ncbi:MAG TPA: tetratricopeptide repeat protein [Nitrospiraceae bacterium]|nr:tetratricopeptide repeat protein [Nitrospiraceae bacterium]
MNRIIGIVVSVAVLGTFIGLGKAWAQRDEIPEGYPQSIEPELQVLLGRLRDQPSSPDLLVKVASTYFDLADDLLTDKAKQQAAYEEGAKAAKQAFQLDETNADAHFFHALNLGNAARLQGATKGALVVTELKSCLNRAIEINPKHAQALQMMGGMLLDLPRFLGGSEQKAQEYLERAIAADGNYANARMLVATLYRKQGRVEDARKQLEAVIQAERPHYRYTWERKYKPEAERILKELKRNSSP